MAEKNLTTTLKPFTKKLQFLTEDLLTSIDNIPSGKTVTIPSGRQMHVDGTLTLVGNLTLEGTLTLTGDDYHAARQGETRIRSITADHTITTADQTILADATSGAITVTLPAASAAARRPFTIKKTDNSSNTVTLSSADNIDGSLTQVILYQYTSRDVLSDATTYWII